MATDSSLVTAEDAGVPVEETPEIARVRKGRRRGGTFKKWLIVTHRWTSLILGLVLVVITTSGALILYRFDIRRWANAEAYAATATDDPIPLVEAIDIVAASDPDFGATSVTSAHGVYRVNDADYLNWVSVDPGTGAILGRSDDGPLHTTMEFLVNLHDCWLSCEDLPSHVPWFAAEVPGLTEITWGGFILGVSGLLLLFLALSGIWLWWPGIKRFATGFRVRASRGRYARDFDLHQVLGMIALPFLLMWAVTGAGFEFPFVADTYYAATPGSAPEEVEFLSEESDEPDITPGQAVDAARDALPAEAVLVDFALPYPDDPTASYYTYWRVGFDPYGQSDYPGDVGVAVERHTGEAVVDFGPPDQAVAAEIWETWNFPVHAGSIVSPWWRLAWFVLGMIPLILAITGLSTWFYKRGVKKARRKARAEHAAVPADAAV